MAPKPEDSNALETTSNKSDFSATMTAQDKEPSCAELYGPYPSAIPVPFLSIRNEGREGAVPADSVIQNAKKQSDVPTDVRDVGTPDEWVKRDGRLVRLVSPTAQNSFVTSFCQTQPQRHPYPVASPFFTHRLENIHSMSNRHWPYTISTSL